MKPKVSVVIPVYNTEKYLEQCLESVLNQTLQDIEVICVDDGSSDRSLDILREFEEKDERVKVVCQRNQYAGAARNNGMNLARGEWITFIDSDDYLELDGLEKLYTIAEKDALEFVKASAYCWNESTQQYEENEWYQNKKAEKIFNIVTRFDEYPEIFLGVVDTPWSGLYRLSFLRNNHIVFPEFQCINDRSFFIECLLKASRISVAELFFITHRVSRKGSLIDRKQYHFDCQISHYYRVKEILRRIDSNRQKKYAELVLRKELNGLIYWYKRLMERNSNRFQLANLMIDFCRTYDIHDIGGHWPADMSGKDIFLKLQEALPLKLCHETVENPKISVIIPVFNTADYLYDCIESVLRQTFQDFEIICIDDNSDDGSYDILLDCAAQDKRIRVFKNTEKGVSHARYQGCSLARAPYVQFLDSDDWLAENALETIFKAQSVHNCDICSFQYYNYDETAKKVMGISSGMEEQFLPAKQVFNWHDCKETILQLITTNLWSKCFRREFISKFLAAGLGLNGSEDATISCYASVFAEKIMHLPVPLYYYRRNRRNSLETAKDRYPLNWYKAYKRLFELLRKEPFFDDVAISYVNRALRGCVFELTSKKTEEGYRQTYQFLKEKAWKELGISGYSPACYYNKKDYACMEYITGYEYIYKKNDLLFLINPHTTDEAKERVVKKYQFASRLEQVRSRDEKAEAAVIFDERDRAAVPCVSVIVPVYNTALYLRSCLDSLKQQTLKNIEIICVNDGSTDDSLHILQRYAEDDHRFVVVSQRNAGQSAARNTGIRLAKGKYLYFCDSDDMLKSPALETLCEKAEQEALDMVFCYPDILFEKGVMTEKQRRDKLNYYKQKGRYRGTYKGKHLLAAMLENRDWNPSPCFSMIRNDYFRNAGLWFIEGIIHEDNMYVFKAMYRADRAGVSDGTFYLRRIRSGSTMTNAQSFANVYEYFYSALSLLHLSQQERLYDEDRMLFETMLKRWRDNAARIYHSLSKEEQGTYQLLPGYEQLLFCQLILNNSDLGRQSETQKQLQWYQKQLQNVKSGYSFRIGRVITFIPRKMRGGIRCYREHGFAYTLKRTAWHMGLCRWQK